jgi:hypothetical protein
MKTESVNYELIFGSNRILNCPLVVEFVGRGINQQIIRFREGEDGVVLFNCWLNDPTGKSIAVVANSKVQHLAPGLKAYITGDGIKVTAPVKGMEIPILDFVKIGPRLFKLNGQFSLPGYRIVATDEGLMINTNLLSHNTFANCSAAIGLG